MSEPKIQRVPLDAAILARFHAELPAVVAWRETRGMPRMQAWGWEALLYAVITVLGVLLWGWSAVLVMLHLMAMQWISLVAEVVVLMRLHRAGVRRLVTVMEVSHFVEAVMSARTRKPRPWETQGPTIQDNWLLDRPHEPGNAQNASPGGLAGTLVFLGTLATAAMVGSMMYSPPGSVRETLEGQTLAIVFMAVAMLLRFHAQLRATTAPVSTGASWNVEFSPGLRVMSVVILGMLSCAIFLSGDDPKGYVVVVFGAIGLWAVNVLLGVPMLRRSTARMRAYLAERARA